MNGNPPVERSFPARDPNDSKDVLGRVGIDLAPSRRSKLEPTFSTGQARTSYDASDSTRALAGSLRYPGVARLIVEYDANLNHQGRDEHGVPAELHDDVFRLRGEAVF